MPPVPTTILLLQGGGALGAYQGGAYEALSDNGYEPDWVGAINAAILCGNPAPRRVERLRAFWEQSSVSLTPSALFDNALPRDAYSQLAAASVASFGVPGFFAPRLPWDLNTGHNTAPSIYRTNPLRRTLEEFVDFDFLNTRGPRLSVGTVDIETGNFLYFDSAETRIGPEHIMASGALPPGFPPVAIEGRSYWDGGLVSNTPLQFVLEALRDGREDGETTIFQIDLFSARGTAPRSLPEVMQREKDIRYSSRTRLTTDRYRALHALRAAASRLAAKLPPAFADDPDLALLRAVGPAGRLALVHLIHRKQSFETSAKDYDFSRRSMRDHWAEGAEDVRRTLAHPDWQTRDRAAQGLSVYDLAAAPQ
jgi:NTE family protein